MGPESTTSTAAARTRAGVPPLIELWRRPLPHLRNERTIRGVCRVVTSISRWQVREMHGLEHVAPDRDPFILALNHSQRPEAVVVPTWLCFHRNGRMVHFMADWNFLLIPVLSWVIRLHDPIVVVRKDAKPRFLNRFKSRFQSPLSPFEQARERLARGQSIGVFPEATTNRHPSQLLRGQVGVARLALESGIPVVPGGIRFPSHRGAGPIGDREPLTVQFGPALQPPCMDRGGVSAEAVAAFHEQIMRAISTLSAKEWQPSARRTKYAVVQE